MKTDNEEKSRYKISDSHRNQIFVGVLKRDRETYMWSWKGHIDYSDGHNFEFASQRSFMTKSEAEDYTASVRPRPHRQSSQPGLIDVHERAS